MIFAALLSGGIGTRIGHDKPKQFLKINNKPILVHSIEKFLKVMEIDKLIVSSPKKYLETTQKLTEDYFNTTEKIVVIEGGRTRNDTILNSINYVKNNFNDNDPILITHDAARIFVSPKLIKRSIKELKNYNASSAVIPSVDVIFRTEGNKLKEIPLRESLVNVQTPQSFRINKFLEIYSTLNKDEIKKLDEAMMLFYLRNEEISLFEGDPNNFKITQQIDLKIAEALIKEISSSK